MKPLLGPTRSRNEETHLHQRFGRKGRVGEALDLPARSRLGEGRAAFSLGDIQALSFR